MASKSGGSGGSNTDWSPQDDYQIYLNSEVTDDISSKYIDEDIEDVYVESKLNNGEIDLEEGAEDLVNLDKMKNLTETQEEVHDQLHEFFSEYLTYEDRVSLYPDVYADIVEKVLPVIGTDDRIMENIQSQIKPLGSYLPNGRAQVTAWLDDNDEESTDNLKDVSRIVRAFNKQLKREGKGKYPIEENFLEY